MRLLADTLLLAALAAAPTPGPAPAPHPAPAAAATAAAPRAASAHAYAHYLRARLAEANGDLPRALEEMRSAAAFDPRDASLQVALAELLARSGEVQRAEAAARKALALRPDGPTAWEAHLLLGKIAWMDRRLGEARRQLQRSVDQQVALAAGRPADEVVIEPESWRALAQVQLESGDEAAAERTIDDLAARRPADGAEVLRDLARFHVERHDPGRAEALLRKAVAADRADVEAWRLLARLAERRDEDDAARQAWQALLREEDDDGEALAAMGRLSLAEGDVGAARAWLDRLVLVSRDDAAGRASAAFAWLDAHRPADALAVVEGGLRIAYEPRLAYLRGVALQELRRHQEAAEAFAAVVSDDEDLAASARAAQVAALLEAGRTLEAERVVDAALRDRPRDVRLQAARAHVLGRTGRTAEAVAYLQAALAQAGRREAPASLYEALATAQEKAGDSEGALTTMRALLDRDPDDAEAMNWVAYTWADRGERLDEAERLVTRALQIRPGNAFFLDTLGWVYFRKGDFARAVEALEKARRRAGPEPTILEHLGEAYLRQGRPADAARAWRQALQALSEGATPDTPEQPRRIERRLQELPP